MTGTREQNRPNVGDPAPDFTLENGQRLSDLKGKTVLITFYPAAFSGIIPTADPITNEAAKTALETKQRSMMMCSMQLTSLDETPSAAHTTDPTIVKLAISSATPKLLNEWKNLLKTHDIDYISDIDYSISQRYGSYDAAQGYNKRVVFIIDKKGEIAFVDDDYTIDDAEKIKQVLRTIDKQP
jgi:peroxiredoxin